MPTVRIRVLVALAAAALAACGAPEPTEPTAAPTPTLADRYSGLVAASEFVVGVNRFPFGLVDINGAFLERAAVGVRFFLVDGEKAALKAEANARWRAIATSTVHVHPDGAQHVHLDFQGVYVVEDVTFDTPGVWFADFVALESGNQVPEIEEAAFRVLDKPNAIGIGEPAPPSDNLTLADAPFAQLSSRQVETDALHNVSVRDALARGEPFVVVFASPQFCVSSMCGPVVDTMEDARDELGGEVEFIHIEPWDLSIARAEGRLVASEYAEQWRLPTEPWVYVVGPGGRVAARFEGLVTGEEVVAAVQPLL